MIPGLGRSPGEEIGHPLQYSWVSLVAQLIKNLPAMRETWVHIDGLGRSPRGGNGYPIQYSGLEHCMNCTESQTQLSDFHLTSLLIQKEIYLLTFYFIAP